MSGNRCRPQARKGAIELGQNLKDRVKIRRSRGGRDIFTENTRQETSNKTHLTSTGPSDHGVEWMKGPVHVILSEVEGRRVSVGTIDAPAEHKRNSACPRTGASGSIHEKIKWNGIEWNSWYSDTRECTFTGHARIDSARRRSTRSRVSTADASERDAALEASAVRSARLIHMVVGQPDSMVLSYGSVVFGRKCGRSQGKRSRDASMRHVAKCHWQADGGRVEGQGPGMRAEADKRRDAHTGAKGMRG
ncbi:hypothetical protein K438DRAFT_1767946 [Mycena galopus ATCC 62051]|nr:hypothetical protein K438DRAFT_1767946 [Mycena galopus ATCC 62051]